MKFTFIIALTFLSFNLYSQQDTSSFEQQRKRVNYLLDIRSSKFGQYDESLLKRTGIFGLKTKKDMQRSIDILTDIVRTDNNIFKELKVLLDYKDMQQTEVKDKYSENEHRISGFMTAIKNLQDQNELLQSKAQKSGNQLTAMIIALLVVFVFVSGAVYYLLRTKKLTFK